MVWYNPSTTFSADAMIQVELDPNCAYCGKTSAAMVTGKGSASENKSVFAPDGSDAGFLADVEAQRDAAELIRLARCPKCGRRSAEGIRGLWMRFVWLGILFAVLAAVGWWAVDEKMLGASDARMYYAIFAVGSFGPLAWKTYEKMRGSRERVCFISSTTSEPRDPYRSTQ